MIYQPYMKLFTIPTNKKRSEFICAAAHRIGIRDYLERRYRLFSW